MEGLGQLGYELVPRQYVPFNTWAILLFSDLAQVAEKTFP